MPVAKSGTAVGSGVAVGVNGPRNPSTPAVFGKTLLPNVPVFVAGSAAWNGEEAHGIHFTEITGSLWAEPLNSGRLSTTDPPMVANVVEGAPNRIKCGMFARREVAAPPLCRFGAVSALFMADPRRVPDVLCVYRATPHEIIKRSSRNCLAVTPITD